MGSACLEDTRSMYKAVIFLHICNEPSENEIKKIPFSSIKKNTMLRNEPNKYKIYTLNRALFKEIKDLNKWISCVNGWEDLKILLRWQCIASKLQNHDSTN